MVSKRIILRILLIITTINISCKTKQVKDTIELSGNTYLCLLREDNLEFTCLFGDLDMITPIDYLNNSIGQKERNDLLNKHRKVTFGEFKKLEKMGDLHIIESEDKIDLEKIANTYIYDTKMLAFNDIPDEQKGLIIKHLWSKGFYVIFKDYQGEYEIVSKNKKVK